MSQDTSKAEPTHRRPGLLKDQVQLARRKDSDRHEIIPIADPLSFEKGFFAVIRACQLLTQKNDGLLIVGVAGPSGAGKTVFTEKILNFMPSVAVISMDNYNDSSRIIDGNYDDPQLTDYDTLLKNIQDLKAGKQAEIPIYDFKYSSHIKYRTLAVPSSRIVIIEGINALSEKLRPLLDLRVSVTGGVHFDLVKWVLRDIQRAGQQPEEIIHQISETVYPMYKAFIEPDLQTAHIKIINKFNPFTGFQCPTYILKSSRSVAVDQIKPVLSEEHTETNEETYDIYLLPPGEDPETCQSYLRMRNKDGKYNLMFEEWVTDAPFVISPRITFEVSAQLLGGLMALGYTIAAILKRSSHVFCDEKVCVKIDWLEQLNRQYIQVQGRDRAVVKSVAEQLGLGGSYTPRTYIEQIQLEKLVNDVIVLPDDLKTKLSIYEDVASSPKGALSRVSAERVAQRNKHLKRADVRIDMPNEVHDIVLMPNVSSRASNSAPATPLFPRDVSSQSSIMTQDAPFGTHFDHPGISNVAASISEKHHDVSASEASNGANAGSEISDDNSSLEASNEVNAGPEIHDHSAPTLIPDISARDIKFLFELNAVIAGITGQAVFNLVASTSTDSPYLRCCAATAGVGFFGSFLAICAPRNQKLAKILSKIGAIGAASAVSIALGITVLKDTKWYVNVVATGIACLVSTAVVVKAN